MTIPTRPAPAPPQMRNFNTNGGVGSTAAADANASLEQLRSQLQQQQQQQKLTIKLPPPPKAGTNTNHQLTSYALKTNISNNNYDFDCSTSTSSITRKFPKARYAPATNWDDTPFDPFEAALSSTTTTKKVPPPRPPPPKVLVNGRQKTTNHSSNTTSTSTTILSNIFHRKKTNNNSGTGISKNAKQQQHSAARLYGVSSGNYAVNPQTTQTTYDSTATTASLSSSAFTNADWNAAWSSSTTGNYASTITTSTTTSQSQNSQDAQLISFDSPPSSPTFTQKSNSDCVSVDSFSSDSNFSSPQNGSVSQPESGFEDDFSATSSRSRPATTSPLDPWEAFSAFNGGNSSNNNSNENYYCSTANIGTAPVRNLTRLNGTVQDNPLCNGRNLVPPAPSVSMPTIIKPKISQKPKAPRPPVFGAFGNKSQQVSAGFGSDNLQTPPMPQCAPPPPPSILDVISGKADAIHLANGAVAGGDDMNYDDEPPYGIALYEFDGAEEGDLSFRESEKIYLLERVSEDWYRGRTRAGCEGIFPVNYIEIRVPLSTEVPAAATVASSNRHTKSNSYNLSSSKVDMPKVRCLYNFPAEVEGDLPLRENDIVTILYRINEDWLFGEINNRQGQFPANFLEYIPANIPLP